MAEMVLLAMKYIADKEVYLAKQEAKEKARRAAYAEANVEWDKELSAIHKAAVAKAHDGVAARALERRQEQAVKRARNRRGLD